jgi:polyhydroxyalkanoate synthesis repressor PhaR
MVRTQREKRPPSMPTARRPSHRKPAAATTEAGGVRVLKKYPNRRLYDTQSSSYITLSDVKQMVLEGEAFEVRDAKDGSDLTRSILLQIILDEESGGVPMFSTEMLAQIIRFYGHAMQGAMGAVLEQNLKAAAQMQARLAQQALTNPMASMQGLMGSYLEQSRSYFEKMQEQVGQAGTLFPGFAPPKK